MSRPIALFDRVSVSSVWWTLIYAARGREILFFEQTRVGRVLASALTVLFFGRLSVRPVSYQVAEHKGLFAEATQLAVAMTEDWVRDAEAAARKGALVFHDQPRRTKTYVKKAVLLKMRVTILRILIFERILGGPDQDGVFVADGSPTTRWLVAKFPRFSGRTLNVRPRPSLPSRLAIVTVLLAYYLSLLRFVASRGIRLRQLRDEYLLAKPAKWPMGMRRSDDFLVDGKTVLTGDLLILHGSGTGKKIVQESIAKAREGGYALVASDRVSVRLRWLMSWGSLSAYVFQPLLQVFLDLLRPRHVLMSGLSETMLRLRRHTLGWDVLFDRYAVHCLIDDSVVEDQAAATISIHHAGGISAWLQSSENLDEFNHLLFYLTCHRLFTWGHGMAELRGDSWCVDEVVRVGYPWGPPESERPAERDKTRADYGVRIGERLVVAFDTSLNRDGRNTPSTLLRYYETLDLLADTVDNTTIVLKPKNSGTDTSNLVSQMPRASGSRVVLAEAFHTDTSQLIAAADLVINMGQSTTLVEAIILGVPSISLDETERDWHQSLSRPASLVFDNGHDICSAALQILKDGPEQATWPEIQARVIRNYGESDAWALDRVRSNIFNPRKSAPVASGSYEIKNQR